MSDYPRSYGGDDSAAGPLFSMAATSVAARHAAADVLEPVAGRRPTSHAAARDLRGKTGTIRRRVWDFIAQQGAYGATDDEIQRMLDIPAHTECPRRGELQLAELIVPAGELRKTRSGRLAIVWVAVGDDGHAPSA